MKSVILNKFNLLNVLFIYSSCNAKQFNVYWNIPTFMCQQYDFPVLDVTKRYGILQNKNDSFRGSKISILYDPGNFPALLENPSSHALIKRNGGVPQKGDLLEHLQVFRKHMDELVPDVNNNGLAIIDFESWRPVYRQNFGTLKPYKDLSVQIEKDEHPRWNQNRIEEEACKKFEKSAKDFMEITIKSAKSLRPRAKWGYYGLPYCFNGRPNSIEDCPREVQLENNDTKWLYDASDIIYPSVYMSEQMTLNVRTAMIRGRIRESIRLAKRSRNPEPKKVIAYYRYLFSDTKNFLNEQETFDALNTIKSSGANGVILWGSSFDLNSRNKCREFYDYLDSTLGPVAHSMLPRIFVEDVKISSFVDESLSDESTLE